MQLLWTPRPGWNQENNVWKKADIKIASADFSNDFRLIIEATVAEGQHGDIAIDDVSFTPGCSLKTEETTSTSTTLSKPDVNFECDFEAGLCGWQTGVTDENFAWTRTNLSQCLEYHFEDC